MTNPLSKYASVLFSLDLDALYTVHDIIKVAGTRGYPASKIPEFRRVLTRRRNRFSAPGENVNGYPGEQWISGLLSGEIAHYQDFFQKLDDQPYSAARLGDLAHEWRVLRLSKRPTAENILDAKRFIILLAVQILCANSKEDKQGPYLMIPGRQWREMAERGLPRALVIVRKGGN